MQVLDRIRNDACSHRVVPAGRSGEAKINSSRCVAAAVDRQLVCSQRRLGVVTTDGQFGARRGLNSDRLPVHIRIQGENGSLAGLQSPRRGCLANEVERLRDVHDLDDASSLVVSDVPVAQAFEIGHQRIVVVRDTPHKRLPRRTCILAAISRNDTVEFGGILQQPTDDSEIVG